MPVPEVLTYMLDPRELYNLVPMWWDMFFFFLLLFFPIREGVERTFGKEKFSLTKLVKGVAKAAAGHEHSPRESILAALVALPGAYGLVVGAGWTFSGLFNTPLYRGFLALMVLLIVYNVMRRHQKTENKLLAFSVALFFGGMVYSIGYIDVRGDFGWWKSVIPIIVIIGIISSLTGGLKEAETAEQTTRVAQRRTRESSRQLQSAQKKCAELQEAAKKAKKEQDDVVKGLREDTNKMKKAIDILLNLGAFQKKVATAFAAAMMMLPRMAPAQIESELRKEYPPAVVEQVKKELAKLPNPAPGKPTPPPPANLDEVAVSPATIEEPLNQIESARLHIELEIPKIKKQIQTLKEVVSKLPSVSENLKTVNALNQQLQKDLAKLSTDAKNLVDRISRLQGDNTALIREAQELQNNVARTHQYVIADTARFYQTGSSTMPILESDKTAIQEIVNHIEPQLKEIEDLNTLLKKRMATVKREGASGVDCRQYNAIFGKLNNLIVGIIQFLEHHGGSIDTLSAAMAGISAHLPPHQKFLQETQDRLTALQAKFDELTKKAAAIEKGQKEEEKAIQIIAADTMKIKDHLTELWTTVTQIEELNVQGGKRKGFFTKMSKTEMDKIHHAIDQANRLIVEMDEERRKIVQIRTPTMATRGLAQLLANIRVNTLVADLRALDNAFKSALGMSEDRANKTLGPVIQQFNQKGYSNYLQKVQNKIVRLEKRLTAELRPVAA